MAAHYAIDRSRGRATTFAANPAQKPFIHAPLPVVTREKINPRIRIQSQTQYASRHRGGNRTMAVIPEGDAISATSADPELQEMQNGSSFDIGSVFDQFVDFHREVRALCELCADYYAGICKLPRITTSRQPPSFGSFVFKAASDFPSVEDFVFFTVLSIINTYTYSEIFRPFHPAASKAENAKTESEYERQMGTVLQVKSAEWRSRRFNALESTVGAELQRSVINRIADSIGAAFKLALTELKHDQLPTNFDSRLQSILNRAYKWNITIKRDVIKYDFEPFVVEPGATWDAEQMEPFEKAIGQVSTPVISTVALGLIGSTSLGGSRVSHIQLKAKVLVEEWFQKTGSRPRMISAMPRPPPPIAPQIRTKPSLSISVSNLEQTPKPSPQGNVQGICPSLPPQTIPLPQITRVQRLSRFLSRLSRFFLLFGVLWRNASLKPSKSCDGASVEWNDHTEGAKSISIPTDKRTEIVLNDIERADAPRVHEGIDEDAVDDFFSVGAGYRIAENSPTDGEFHDLTNSRLGKTPSTDSLSSAGTFLTAEGGYSGQLGHLIQLINGHTALLRATITSTECYSNSILIGATHEFLILELERAGKKTIWLRLDRRRDTSITMPQLFLSRGSTPANDTYRLAAAKELLISMGDRHENRQIFVSPPTLHQLNQVLDVIIDSLSTYEVWPNNCWFFTSLIQERLRVLGVGEFTFGELRWINLDPKTRESIVEEVQRRAHESEKRLEDMHGSAMLVLNGLDLDASSDRLYSQVEVTTFVRFLLRDVQLRDLSLVDLIATKTRDSFTSAIHICGFVRSAPGLTPDNRLITATGFSSSSSTMIAQLRNHILLNLDPEIHSAVMENSSIHPPLAEQTWGQHRMLHCFIAITCLEVMENYLRFNISGISTSYLPLNRQEYAARLHDASTKNNITPSLIYSCSYWAYHISSVPGDQIAGNLAVKFIDRYALHWLEVLNLLGVNALTALEPLCDIQITNVELQKKINELVAFVKTFSVPISRSVPHIYLSALAFASTTLLARQIPNEAKAFRLVSYQNWTWNTILRSAAPDESSVFDTRSKKARRDAKTRCFNVDMDGWVTGRYGELILWVPPDLREKFQSRTISTTNDDAMPFVEFGDFTSEQWANAVAQM